MTMSLDNDKKSITQQVIAELLTGKPLKSKEISKALSQKYDEKTNLGYVSSILARISNKNNCDLGFFIKKTREGNAYVYSLVPECLALSEAQAFGLCLKTGKQRYPLARAINDYPELARYLEPDSKQGDAQNRDNKQLKDKPAIQVIKKIAEKGKFLNIKPFSGTVSTPGSTAKDMEISIRYSGKYAMSVTASAATFALICAVLVLMIAALCFAAYLFIYPILIALITILVTLGIAAAIRKHKLE